MCPLSLPQVRRSRGSVVTAVASLLFVSAITLGAASPGATFEELPEAQVGMGLTLQLASSTAGVLSRITAIPEPASCLLFGTAAFGLLAIRKRLRQRT